MSTPPSSPPAFTLFPRLPPELRLQIYRHLCHARVTTLTYHPTTNTFQSPTPPPALLQLCRESRAEGLRLYVKCLLPSPPPSSSSSSFTPTYTHHRHPSSSPPRSDHHHHHPRRSGERDGSHDTVTIDEFENEQANRSRSSRHPQTRYFYHHPRHDTLYLPRPSPATGDLYGMGYAAWAREFAARLPGLAGVVRRLAVDYVPGEVRRPWEVFGKVCLMRGCAGLEEAFLVIGPSSSSSSFSASGSGSAAVEECGTGGGDGCDGGAVEFVDPRAGDREIMGIMERVRESFRFELGDEFGLGLGAKGGVEDRAGREGLELVPKVVGEWGCRPAVCA